MTVPVGVVVPPAPRASTEDLAGDGGPVASALLRRRPDQAEAFARLLLTQGSSVTDLCDDVLQPLLDHHHQQHAAGHIGTAEFVALQQAVLRLLLRLPAAAGDGSRGEVLLLSLVGDPAALPLVMLGQALEHHGYTCGVLPEVSLAELTAYARAHCAVPPVVVLSLDRPPADLARLRTELRRLRAELAGTRVLLTGRTAREHPALAATLGAEGVAVDTATGLRLVDLLVQPLTSREIETLRLVAGGRTNRQIATALGIAPSTVKSSLDRVFDKLRTPDRAAAAAVAVRRGWIE